MQIPLNGKKGENRHMYIDLKSPRSNGGDVSPLFFLITDFFETVAHDPEHRGAQMFD